MLILPLSPTGTQAKRAKVLKKKKELNGLENEEYHDPKRNKEAHAIMDKVQEEHYNDKKNDHFVWESLELRKVYLHPTVSLLVFVLKY